MDVGAGSYVVKDRKGAWLGGKGGVAHEVKGKHRCRLMWLVKGVGLLCRG